MFMAQGQKYGFKLIVTNEHHAKRFAACAPSRTLHAFLLEVRNWPLSVLCLLCYANK